MSDYATQPEKAYTASLPSEQEQDEAAERRHQLEQSFLAKDLINLIALAEAVIENRTHHDVDVVKLACGLVDILGSVEDPYQINEVLK